MTDLALVLPRSSLFLRQPQSSKSTSQDKQTPNQVILQTLEAHAISTTDLLTLSPVEVQSRTKLGVGCLQAFRDTIIKELWTDLGFGTHDQDTPSKDPALGLSFGGGGSESTASSPLALRKKRKLDDVSEGEEHGGGDEQTESKRLSLEHLKVPEANAQVEVPTVADSSEASHEPETFRQKWKLHLDKWAPISTLDPKLDVAFNGGIPAGYVTEIVGESTTGKTTFLMGLLLAVQLPPPYGLSKEALYLTTESRMPTERLVEIMSTNKMILEHQDPSRPVSIENVHTLAEPLNDLEVQDHVLNYQVPVFIRQRNIGLVVLDSVAANYRAEMEGSTEALSNRGHDLVRLGKLLRSLANEGVAVVVANQVGDRFDVRPEDTPSAYAQNQQQQQTVIHRRPPPPPSQSGPFSSSPIPLPTSTPTPPPKRNGATAQHSLTHLGPPSSSGAPESPTVSNGLSQVTDMIPSYMPTPTTLTLDHQLRFFTGWGDIPPQQTQYTLHHLHLPNAEVIQSQNLKTPTLGLIWANQIACRVALKVLSGSDSHGLDEEGAAEEDNSGRDGNAGAITQLGRDTVTRVQEQSRRNTPITIRRQKRRALTIVFAPWVAGTPAMRQKTSSGNDNEQSDMPVPGPEGIEYEIRGDGFRIL